MAVRFDNSADRLLRTTDLIDYNAAYTWMGWMYLVSDLNLNSIIWSENDGTTNNQDSLRTNSDGTTLETRVAIAAVGTTLAGSALTVGVWYHLAAVRESATALKIYLNGVLDITNTRDITGRASPTRMEHAAYLPGNSLRSDSRADRIKAWSVALTIDEINAERWSIRPQRTANLYGFWPTWTGADRVADYSGNGRNWTEAGTLTDEDPAPVSWGAQSTRIFVPEAVAATGHPMALRHTLDRTGVRRFGRGIGA